MKRPEVWFFLTLVLVAALDWVGREWALNNLANPRLGHPLVLVVEEPGTVETQIVRRFGSPSQVDVDTVRDLDGKPFGGTQVLERGEKIIVPKREFVWLKDGLAMRLVFNKGATFGLQLSTMFDAIMRTILGVLGVWICYRTFQRTRNLRRAMAAAMGMMWGGALGNLWSRLEHGYVVDFVALDLFPRWPVFNIADAALTLGAVAVVTVALIQPKRNFSLPS